MAAAAVRPSEAKKVRASENTTQRLDLIKILHMWRDEAKMKELVTSSYTSFVALRTLVDKAGPNVNTNYHTTPETTFRENLIYTIGGGNSHIFIFTPGELIQFDLRIFFKWLCEPTTN